ncbi:MAG TPA: MFS transporter [Trinickia sp.]|jgi:MFS family permease|uniref:MFS transporter n=1 Tax=Trinickia sp. TaxID=2571163 RepID=UPI002C4511C1|nr:MFS transporter [Trinickia sp.]HTI18049.1 MFS transporter [Trinickia sp.]
MKVNSKAPQSAIPFIWITATFMINMMGTTLPTPIYRYYQLQYGFTAPMVTVIYASYALGVLAALLTVGNWSDQLGRRRMLFAGLCASALSAIAFIESGGLAGLLLARLLSGISAGIFTGTATVTVIELAPPAWRSQATLAAAASNMLGLGCGPLLSGVLVQTLPDPMLTPYVVHLGLLCFAVAGVWFAPETAARPDRVNLRFQRISLPQQVRDAFVPAALTGFAGFVVVGFFAAVAPQLIGAELGYRNAVVIGALVFLVFACSGVGQVMQGRLPDRWRQPVGCIALMAGLIAIAACAAERSLSALLIGTVLAGVGQGIGLRASLAELAANSPANRRAEVTSSFFVVLYVAISLPVIGLGLVVQRLGIERATLIFAVVTTVIVFSALVLLVRRGSGRPACA